MQKVLVITYYWPPAGGPGVQRWLKFVTYLREFGIEPIVYIPENPFYPLVDESFINEIPEGITIYKNVIKEPYRLAELLSKGKTKKISSGIIEPKNPSFIEKTMLWIRGNFFIPDARKSWVKPSISFLKDVIEKEQLKTIITTGPPHSVHLIGLGLQKELGVEWLADFRDPWTTIGYHKKLRLSKNSQKKHKELEQTVLLAADKIIVTSKTCKSEFQKITSKPIEVITNGYEVLNSNEPKLDSDFTLSHIGSLLGGRSPKNLWKVLAELIKVNIDFKNALKLQFAGVISEEAKQSIEENGLTEFCDFMGYLSHEKSLEIQRKSQVLLLLEIDSEETKGIIPGKYFEYMASRRPILAIGPNDWEVSEMIAETKTGFCFNHDDATQLKKLILDWFNQFKAEKLQVKSIGIEKYSRRALTKKLAKYIQWE